MWGPRLWQRRLQLVWLPVAIFAAIGSLPSETLHPPVTLLLVLFTAAWKRSAEQRDFRRALQRAFVQIGQLRNRADAFETAATTDTVTELPNRPAFYAALEETLKRSLDGANGAPALMLIDLDRFKQINDTYGHASGDAVLIRVARILQEETRADDLVERLGGDEFGVLLHRTTTEGLQRILKRIKSAADSRPLHITRGGEEIYGSFSVGGVMLSEHPDIDDALMAAERGLYTDKERLGPSRAA